MPNIIYHDFETYSEADLKKVGAFQYANHPSTRIICLSFAFNDEEPCIYTPQTTNLSDIAVLLQRIKLGWELHAWNAEFEFLIWNYCGTKQFDWPKIPLEQYHDTMAFATSFALPAHLADCGKALNLDIQKDKRGTYLINKLSKPRKPTKSNPHIRWSYEAATQDYEDMYSYCIQDVQAERAIAKVLPYAKLLNYERQLWLMTVNMNVNGVPIDIETVKNLKHLLDDYETTQVAKLQRITNGDVATPGQRDKIIAWAKKQGLELPDLTANTVKTILESKLQPPKPVVDVLTIRQKMSRTSTKKFDRLIDSVDKNGFIHDILFYHRATTGRWGGKNFQVHNLPNAKVKDPDLVAYLVKHYALETFMLFYDDPMYVGSAMVRPIVAAKPGYKLIVSDFSSIENRVTCWLAGDEESLKLFRKNMDQYKWFATKLYNGITYEDVNKHQRTHAKTAILGLGYGMGYTQFHKTCVSYGFDIDLYESKRTVQLYREIFHLIVTLWDKLYTAAKTAIIEKALTRYKHIRFLYDHDFLFMILPSGRRIAYYKPLVEPKETPWGEIRPCITFMGSDPYTRKWKRLQIIPGRLIENAAQGLARDILAEAKIRLIKQGYNVIFSVHDEVVSHDPENFGSLDHFTKIMCDTDKQTYPGLPIDSEGFITNRYKKG